jgi:alkyldihydroxyacetonephosphate synthase
MAGEPTPPIAFAGSPTVTGRLGASPVPVDDALRERLAGTGATLTAAAPALAEASRDWWPLAMTWAPADQVGALASVVVRPTEVAQVPEVLRICNDARVPVTPAAGRSGVVGGSVPLFGGVLLDLCGLSGIRSVDADSMIVDVLAGTFGDLFEDQLQAEHGLTVGHWPQSVALSTVGGWLACRGAGQLSNRYGKIEDIVIGLDVVLADGTTLTTGGHARQSAGPDLNQLFIGSEGTLGVITSARLRAHPVATATHRSAWSFPSFEAGADACRRISQRGLAPAALRLYDAAEADRSYSTGEVAVLLVFDEGDTEIVRAATDITEQECSGGSIPGSPLDGALVEKWLGHRNDVSSLEALISRGYVVDTMELTVAWSGLDDLYMAVRDAIAAVPGVMASTAHLSHSYTDGACLYFTFAGKPTEPTRAATEALYLSCWDEGTRTALRLGGSLSHHHGVGLNRARFMDDALGAGAMTTLGAIKDALDPNGILNPGKLGLRSPFGATPFPMEAGA